MFIHAIKKIKKSMTMQYRTIKKGINRSKSFLNPQNPQDKKNNSVSDLLQLSANTFVYLRKQPKWLKMAPSNEEKFKEEVWQFWCTDRLKLVGLAEILQMPGLLFLYQIKPSFNIISFIYWQCDKKKLNGKQAASESSKLIPQNKSNRSAPPLGWLNAPKYKSLSDF